MGNEIERLDAEKETIEQTMIMLQKEYKETKIEAEVFLNHNNIKYIYII